MPSKMLHYATICIVVTMLFIASQGDLTLYIHPRYILFTVVSVSIGLAIYTYTLFSSDKAGGNAAKNQTTILGYLPLLIVAISALILSPVSLSQLLASDRSSESTQNSVEKTSHSTLDTFSTDLTRFSIADWNNLLASGATQDQIVGKQAKLEGFLYEDNTGQLFIARFRLTCCAVDATPLAVPIVATQELEALELGSWVELEGDFVDTATSSYQFKLDVKSFTQIEEPDEPYIF